MKNTEKVVSSIIGGTEIDIRKIASDHGFAYFFAYFPNDEQKLREMMEDFYWQATAKSKEIAINEITPTVESCQDESNSHDYNGRESEAFMAGTNFVKDEALTYLDENGLELRVVEKTSPAEREIKGPVQKSIDKYIQDGENGTAWKKIRTESYMEVGNFKILVPEDDPDVIVFEDYFKSRRTMDVSDFEKLIEAINCIQDY